MSELRIYVALISYPSTPSERNITFIVATVSCLYSVNVK
jgi:hypothetical protein